MIYFDNASSSQTDPLVIRAMLPFFHSLYSNPSNFKTKQGLKSLESVEYYRGIVSDFFHCLPQNIYWTSGATESNNIVLNGVFEKFKHHRCHIISSTIEHKSVINPLQNLIKKGAALSLVNPDENGVIDLEKIEKLIKDETRLISLMYVNNEIGIVNDIQELSKLCQSYNVLLHVDASQAIGKIEFNLSDIVVDFLTMSGHKFYGPKGIGALYIRNKKSIKPLTFGGGQENGVRPGTLNVPGLVGFGEAINILKTNKFLDINHINELKSRFENLLLNSNIPMRIFGSCANRAPHISSIMFDVEKINLFVQKLSEKISFSTGSACDTEINEPSHVLTAMNLAPWEAKKTLRFSFGRFNTQNEIELAAKLIIDIVKDI